MNKIIAVILAVAAFFFLNSYDTKTYPELAEMLLHEYEAAAGTYKGAAREQLDEEQQQLYDLIKGAIAKTEAEIVINRFNYSDDDLYRVIWCVMHDSPEIFWVDWTNWTVTRTGENDPITLTPVYIFAVSDIPARQAEFATALAKAVEMAKGESAEESRVRLVHDYFVNNVVYDEKGPATVHSAYGALVEGVAVCDGYARAIQLVLTELGIECLYVEGRTKGSEVDAGHAWNIVTIDGVSYHLDATWDDIEAELPDYPDDWEYERAISHSFYLISDEEIEVTHVKNSPIELPACESYGFFEQRGLQTDGEYSEISDAVEQRLYDSIKGGKYYVEFRLLDEEEYQQATDVATRYDYMVKGIFDTVNTMFFEAGDSLRITQYKIIALPNNCVLLTVLPGEV
jgi:Uncharacterized protein involved in cytokinesis, contains TGc (transglutaminase/protease-like) domain